MTLTNIGRELREGRGIPAPAATPVKMCRTVENLPLIACGNSVPADNTAGFAIGCLFQHTDGGNATALYVNEGTAALSNFNAITVGA